MKVLLPDSSVAQPDSTSCEDFFSSVVAFKSFLTDAAYDLSALHAYINEFDPKRAEKFKWHAVSRLEDLHDQTRVECWNLIKYFQDQYAFKPAYVDSIIRQHLRKLSRDLEKTHVDKI